MDRGIGMEKKLFYAFLVIYFLVLLVNLDKSRFVWDEAQNSVSSIFLMDFLNYFMKNPTFDISQIKNFALNYHSHYQVYLSLLIHPPLQRILSLVGMTIFGINEFGARFFSPFFGIVGIYYTFLLAELMFNDTKKAILSALLLALSPLYFNYSKMVLIEIYVTSLVTASLYYFFEYYKKRNSKSLLYFSAAFTLAVLTKLSAILVLPIVLGFSYLNNKKMDYRYFLPPIAVVFLWLVFSMLPKLLFNIPSVISYAYVNLLYFRLPDPLLLDSVISQFQPVLGFFVLLGIIFAVYQRIYGKKQNFENDYLLIWAAAFWLFFIIFMGNHILAFHRYALPAMPALVILTANFIYKFLDRRLIPLLLVLFSISLYNYSAQTVLTYPFEETAMFLKDSTPQGGGVIISDFSLQFYLMKYDRNLNIYAYIVNIPENLNQTIYGEFSDPMNKELGITTPKFYFAAIKEPSDAEVPNKFDLNYHPEMYEYLDKNFELATTIKNQDSIIYIYKLT